MTALNLRSSSTELEGSWYLLPAREMDGTTLEFFMSQMEQLYKRWLDLCKSIRKADYPSRVLSELNRASSILRDIFDDSFTGNQFF